MGLLTDLERILDADRVLARQIDRVAFANDASVYRLVPQVVVFPRSIDEVRELFRVSRARRVPLTFRAAGTSLSGQAVTDGILAVLSRHWGGVHVEDSGARVRVQPGIIGDVVNRHLAPYGAKIGPDPASINACMMGGILANNSSGMCCGVEQNAYHTLAAIRFVLPSGLVVDTAHPRADERLRREAPELVDGLLRLKRHIEADDALRERIRSKYRMKNTTGYSLNAFLDYERPVDILGHLMIGSEGTLGFIAEAVLDTVPDYRLKYTGLLFFGSVPDACASIAALRGSGARALELMDRASLRAIAAQPGAPTALADLPRRAAALLVEYQHNTEDELECDRRACAGLLPSLPLLHPPEFTRDAERQAALWRVRKGLIPSVGAMRRGGTSFILEDVVFPVERLADGVTDLQALFAEHGYDDAIVFGHAKDGNLHFVLIQAFDRADDVERYDRFMQDLAALVAGRYDGALKAEHGTGRNMAPFVATEWGAEAYAVMRELKRLIDPDGLLNPGVILNDDPRAHVRHLKALPPVEPEIDACIECGFCERMCPSRELTLTPRQRIVVQREVARLRRERPDAPELRQLERDFRYAGLETCAADGMCALACPVGIDTGELVKRLRARGAVAEELAASCAERFARVEAGARVGLALGHAAARWFGDRALEALGRAARARLGLALPVWGADAPRPARGLPRTSRDGARAVYFPSCVSRVLGADGRADSGDPLPDTLVRVAARGGHPLWIPDEVHGTCCGMPFFSKGYGRAGQVALRTALAKLWDWSQQGALPVVVDSSPCALTLKQGASALDGSRRARHERLRVLDGVELAQRLLSDGLAPRRRKRRVALHPVCSLHRMGLLSTFESVAAACAEHVDVPIAAGCCGFGGDRGFLVPELTAAATRAEAAEIAGNRCDGHYSSSRTCEIGLTRATGRPYRSVWQLLDEVTGPRA